MVNNPLNTTDPDGKKPKRVIDVFLTYDTTKEGRAEWRRLQKDAARNGIRINIYRTDNGTATADKFIQSIQTKGRSTILVGHSYATEESAAKRKGIGIDFQSPTGIGTRISTKENVEASHATHTVDGINARATNIAVLVCNFGQAFDRLGSSTKTNFFYTNGGRDGESGLDSQNQAAVRLTRALARGAPVQQALQQAREGFDAFRNQYDDETVEVRTLRPASP